MLKKQQSDSESSEENNREEYKQFEGKGRWIEEVTPDLLNKFGTETEKKLYY